MEITEGVVRCWRKRCAPGSVVGAEEDRGSCLAEGKATHRSRVPRVVFGTRFR